MKKNRAFVFTLNNPKDSKPETMLNDYEYLVYQKEKGESGTEHLQGYVYFKTQRLFTAVSKMLPTAHIEFRQGNHTQAKNYCVKKESRIEGPFEFGTEPVQGKRTDLCDIKDLVREFLIAPAGSISSRPEKNKLKLEILDKYPGDYIRYKRSIDDIIELIDSDNRKTTNDELWKKLVLKDWQQAMVDDIKTQNNREIWWIIDETGGLGKTTLGRWMEVNMDCFYCRGGMLKDVAFAYNYQEYVVFDFTRDSFKDINYDCIESFKDGTVFSSKYGSTMKSTNGCKVLCFSNQYPEEDKMSKDRLVKLVKKQ